MLTIGQIFVTRQFLTATRVQLTNCKHLLFATQCGSIFRPIVNIYLMWQRHFRRIYKKVANEWPGHNISTTPYINMQPLFPQCDGKTDVQFQKLIWGYSSKPNHNLTLKEIVNFKQNLFESFAADEEKMHEYEALLVAIFHDEST